MAIFYTDSGSFNNLTVTGSVIISASRGTVLQLKSSGSTIFSVSGSSGEIFNISDAGSSTSLFALGSGSVDILNIDNTKKVSISGSLVVTGSITGSLQGTSSWATNAVTASEVLVTDTTTGTSYYVTFVDGTTADRAVRVDSNGLLFNATTNTLTTTSSYAITSSYALTSAGGTGGISQGKVVAIATGYSNLF